MTYDADIYNIQDIDPSDTYTEKIKPENNSSYHPDADGGRTDETVESSKPPPPPNAPNSILDTLDIINIFEDITII